MKENKFKFLNFEESISEEIHAVQTQTVSFLESISTFRELFGFVTYIINEKIQKNKKKSKKKKKAICLLVFIALERDILFN